MLRERVTLVRDVHECASKCALHSFGDGGLLSAQKVYSGDDAVGVFSTRLSLLKLLILLEF
jgi:hypothetical protein